MVIWNISTLTEERDVKRVGYLVVSTDRGLCGGLNINLFKKLLADMKAWSDKGVQCDIAMIGSKGVSFFNSVGGNVVAQVTGMGDNPSLSELIGPVKVMLQAYDEGRLDRLYVVSNKFINTMSQVPTLTQMLPLPASEDEELKQKHGITCMNQTRNRCWIPCCVVTLNLRFIRAW